MNFVFKTLEICIKNDEICITNDEICTKNDDICIKNDDICIENDDICIENDGICIRLWITQLHEPSPTTANFTWQFSIENHTFQGQFSHLSAFSIESHPQRNVISRDISD